MLDRLRRLFQPTATRRFDAAAGGRRWQGAQSFGHIAAEVAAAAGPVRRRAGYFARNNPWLGNGVTAIVTGAVGAGIKPMSTHSDPVMRADLQRRWNAWTPRSDADGLTDAYGQQSLAVRTMVEAGECFAHLIYTDDGLRVRLLDPEMVAADESRELGNGARIVQGIEFAADGTRLAYHVRKARPGDLTTFDYELVRVPAEQMAHLFLPLAPGQVRGISWLAPVLLRLHEIDLWEDAALVRQKVAALFAGFVVDPTGNAVTGDGAPVNGVLETGLEPGTLKVLPSGTDIRFSDPAEMGDSVSFMKLQLRSVAAGLGVPAYLLDGDLSQANYSSLRAGLVEFRQRLEALQYHVIAHQLLRPIWRAWVLNELLAGRIAGELEDLLSVEFITPKQPWVDPQKDAAAEAEMLRLGLKSRRQAVAEQGWDVEALDAEIAADRARERGLGLNFNGGAADGRAADPAG